MLSSNPSRLHALQQKNAVCKVLPDIAALNHVVSASASEAFDAVCKPSGSNEVNYVDLKVKQLYGSGEEFESYL